MGVAGGNFGLVNSLTVGSGDLVSEIVGVLKVLARVLDDGLQGLDLFSELAKLVEHGLGSAVVLGVVQVVSESF